MNNIFSYQCHAFHEALPDGKASGQLNISAQGISFSVNNINGLLPLENLNISLGGASNRIVFIAHPNTPEITLYTSDLSILENSVLRAHPECIPQLHLARKKRQSSWAIFSAIVLFLISLPFIFFFQMDRLSGNIANQIPTQWETKLGQSVAAQFRMTHQLMPIELSESLIKPLATPLLTALSNSPFTYQFTIVNDGDLNAFALPGGFLTINSGLILKAESAEELLGVMAHEIGHVEARHGVRSIIGKAGIYLVASTLLGDIQGLLATISSAAPMLLSQQYSRQFETDADENAVILLQQAKINPEGLPIFFEKMILEEQKILANIENENARTAYKKAMTLLSTHPTSEARITHLKKLIASTHGDNYINLENEFKALQQAVKDFVSNLPQDVAAHAKVISHNDNGAPALHTATKKGNEI
jgi:beta-barrel assembly-enhancing protease